MNHTHKGSFNDSRTVVYHTHPDEDKSGLNIESKVTMDKTDKAEHDDKVGRCLVVVGLIITFVAGIGHINSYGLVFNDFMSETHSSANSLTTANGVFAMMLAFGGIFLNSISVKLPLYIGGLMGAAIFVVGSMTTVLITNLNQLPITYGLLQGLGIGIMMPVAYSTFNGYFNRNRTSALSFCKAIQGVSLIFYPQLVKYFMTFYGFRGTLLLICGVSLHAIPGMIAMRNPYEQHLANKGHNTEEKRESIELLNDREKNGNKQEKKNRTPKIFLKLLQILNLGILKSPSFCNICIGQSFVNFADLTFFFLHPMLLFQYNYDQKQVAACISIAAGADVAGRFCLAILSSVTAVNTRLLFYIATFLTFIIRLVMLQVRGFLWMAIITGFLGILKAWIHVTSPLVISRQVSHKDFPGAYAVYMLCSGITNILLGQIIGKLKDATNDYMPAFYVLALCCLPCLLLWPVEYFIHRKRQRQATVD